MRLEIVRDEAGFAALEPVWDGLLERGATCTPFLRWDWVRLWWDEFHTDFQLTIGVLRDDAGGVVAIAPLMIGQESVGMRRHLKHLGFLAGLGEAKGERMDFLVPAGREAELTPLLCGVFRVLEGEWEAVRLNKLPEESPNHPHVVRALSGCSSGAGVVIRTECACIQMGASWEDFEAQMRGRHRRDLKRRYELLKKEHQGYETEVTAADAEARLDEFAELHRQHFPDGVSSFLTPRAWRFHRRLGIKWLKSGKAILPFMAVGSGMVGGIYGFVERDEFFFFQVGWNASFARYSMGHLGIRWTVQSCIRRGLRLFDMLPGTYRYKADWTQTSRHVLDIEAYEPESVRAAIFRTVRSVKRLVMRTLSLKNAE
ncbi:CelD/BcsL family acetyltransferase involved in cellulose biosynthesis [Prosthecobacter fusiformis]|uniref:CelD/BcsL family acetyltransferase involved in cellulose biosynthesis n=1 Tax=Prosthecobacter fusiformis TaxID=48464 RepID=A0A4R7RRD4_9BACT|nr:GNAT family N-acetyltransferase [Prosthecobacter fusiformis]TDU68080.1 CelD/BcsL family acetyltransferase involved in cellulose biosynthesis [Prosthecobacter fusiformis]